MIEFKNKTALIIGGTSGIGKATFQSLLDNGTQVHIVGRNIDKFKDTPNLTKHKTDITKSDDVLELISKIEQLESLII